MPLVLYEVACAYGPAQDGEALAFRYEGTRSGDLDLATLRQVFPEQGDFHFRAKTEHPSFPGQFVWLDLCLDSDVVPRTPGGQPPHVRAVPLNYDSDTEDQVITSATAQEDVWGEENSTETTKTFESNQVQEASLLATHEEGGEDEEEEEDMDFFGLDPKDDNTNASEAEQRKRFERRASSSSVDDSDSSENISSDEDSHSSNDYQRNVSPQQQKEQAEADPQDPASASVEGYFGRSAFGSSVTSFLKKSAKEAANAASKFAAASAEGVPNTQQRGALGHLSRLLNESADFEVNKDHMGLLKSTWRAAFGNAIPFEFSSARWKRLGFSGERPTLKCGVLGYQCLEYHMGSFSKVNPFSGCKIGSVMAPCVSKTVAVLSDLFALSDRGFEHSSRAYWALFDSGLGAFYELVSLVLSKTNRLVRSGQVNSAKVALTKALDDVHTVFHSQSPPRTIDALHNAMA